jgi:hypothetical protein
MCKVLYESMPIRKKMREKKCDSEGVLSRLFFPARQIVLLFLFLLLLLLLLLLLFDVGLVP